MISKTLSHDDLVERAARWLRSRCRLVYAEPHTSASEIPDAIGWDYRGFSTVIECKTSVSDFYSDRSKASRRSGRGVGWWRYYLTPPGLLTSRKWSLPAGWGLLECHQRQIRKVHNAEHLWFVQCSECKREALIADYKQRPVCCGGWKMSHEDQLSAYGRLRSEIKMLVCVNSRS